MRKSHFTLRGVLEIEVLNTMEQEKENVFISNGEFEIKGVYK